MALKTMSKILPRWRQWAENSVPFFGNATYPLPQRSPKFAGEIIQRFNLRNKKPAAAYNDKITEIQDFIENDFVSTLKSYNMVYDIASAKAANFIDSYCLAQIPDFGALNQRSHEHGVPIFTLNDKQMGTTGPVKTQMLEKQRELNIIFENLVNAIIKTVK